MSITKVTEIVEDKDASETQDQAAAGITTEINRHYVIETNDASHNQPYILNIAPQFGVPRQGDVHPQNSQAYVLKRDPRLMDGSKTTWGMTVGYSTDFNRQTGTGAGPPTQRTVSTRKIDVVITRDVLTDELMQTSAGERFSPADLVFQRTHRVVTYTRNESSFNENVADLYVNRVNNTPWKGKASKTVLCQDISATETFVQQDQTLVPFWKVTYHFEHNPDDWKHRPLDAGFFEKPGLGGGLGNTRIEDGNGLRYTEPWPLDGNGKALTQAQVTAGNAFIREYDVYQLANFNNLGL